MDQVRASYAGIISFSDVDLAKMMVIDACFILEICLKLYEQSNKYYLSDKMQTMCIALDLVLLENQIPFFVLQDMFDCTVKTIKTLSLCDLLHMVVVTKLNPFSDHKLEVVSFTDDSTHDHVLGYLHKCYQFLNDMPSKLTNGTETMARKLLAMKIKSYLIACFSWCLGKPTLLVPKLIIDDETERILRNLIAYEHCLPKVHTYFTSYVNALHYIVQDQEDVGTLVELEALVNHLPSNKEAAYMLKAISKHVHSVDFDSNKDLIQLKNYFDSCWLRNLRWLRRTYVSSPWSVIALVVGIILFTLTVVQPVFTIKGPL